MTALAVCRTLIDLRGLLVMLAIQEVVAALGITVTEGVLLGVSQVCPSGNVTS